jgi:hypothetical protein
MYGGFELFMQYDKSNNYDWTFAKTKLCVLLLADASYILNKVDGLLTPTVIRILRIAHWLSTTLPTNSAVDNVSTATLRLRSMYGTLAAMDSVQTIEEAELYKQFPLKDAPYPVTDTEAQVALGYVFDSIMVIENQFNERILEESMKKSCKISQAIFPRMLLAFEAFQPEYRFTTARNPHRHDKHDKDYFIRLLQKMKLANKYVFDYENDKRIFPKAASTVHLDEHYYIKHYCDEESELPLLMCMFNRNSFSIGDASDSEDSTSKKIRVFGQKKSKERARIRMEENNFENHFSPNSSSNNVLTRPNDDMLSIYENNENNDWRHQIYEKQLLLIQL